jgi:hypothetical protein
MIRIECDHDPVDSVVPGTLSSYEDAFEVIVCGGHPMAMSTLSIEVDECGATGIRTCRIAAAHRATWRPE